MKQNDTSKLQQVLGSKKTLDEASLKQAAERAAKGDTSQISAIIQSVMKSPGGAELLERLNGVIGQK